MLPCHRRRESLISATTHDPSLAEQVRAILLGYLQCRAACRWPGSDRISLDDVVGSYPQEAAAGRVPGLPELRRRFPDLDAALAAWFTEHTPNAGRSDR
jgi:hypothetical protein